MQNEETAETWRAAQYRRTDDLAGWLSHLSKQSEKMIGADVPRLKRRHGWALGLATAVITLAAVSSVSALVDVKKSPHVVIRPTGPMPAVNVP
jgi:hypothetical protein